MDESFHGQAHLSSFFDRPSWHERFPGMEMNIMLIIDYLDEANTPAEKPNHRVQPVVLRKGPGTTDPLYHQAQDQQRNLQQVAHNARLLKQAKESGDRPKTGK